MRPYLWLLVASLLCHPACAAQADQTTDQRVGEGLMAMLKGEKQKAWDLLFPEAKTGNVVAMYHLGTLMLRSPEYPDNLRRAERFFKAASERGHKGSEAMLAQVKKMQSLQGATPTIAGTSGLPVPKDLEAAKKAYTDMQERIGRFVEQPRAIPAIASVKIFVTENSGTLAEISQIAKQAKARFGEKVDFEYYVSIDPATWDPRRLVSSNPSDAGLTGFRPDLNGQEARKYGVRTMPAIVLVQPKSPPKLLTNPQTVISELAAAIR